MEDLIFLRNILFISTLLSYYTVLLIVQLSEIDKQRNEVALSRAALLSANKLSLNF